MVCETCTNKATWRNYDGSFACRFHREVKAVHISEHRRDKVARWARNLPNTGTVKLMKGTHLHYTLIKAFNGKHRFTDLQDDDQNAGSLQKALILGFIDKDSNKVFHSAKATGDYFITELGRNVLYMLAYAQERKFIKVPYVKNNVWAEHAQTYTW